MFLESFHCLVPEFLVTTTKGFGTHIGGHEGAFHHALSSGQQAFQRIGHTGGLVAGALLGSDADLQDGGKGARQ